MSPEQRLNDRRLAKYVNRKLEQSDNGMQNRVTAKVSGGDVELTGAVEREQQRRLIVRTIRRIRGVRRVVGDLRVEPDWCTPNQIQWSSI